MTRSGRLAAAAALLLGASAAPGVAQAAPFAVPSVAESGDVPIVRVRGGCGFGAHRGPFGGCRLNRGPRGALRAAITGAPRGCPPGRYRRPGGFCR